MYKTFLTELLPPLTRRLPRRWPLSSLKGATPTRAAILFRSRVPNSGNSANKARGRGLPTARRNLERCTQHGNIANCCCWPAAAHAGLGAQQWPPVARAAQNVEAVERVLHHGQGFRGPFLGQPQLGLQAGQGQLMLSGTGRGRAWA